MNFIAIICFVCSAKVIAFDFAEIARKSSIEHLTNADVEEIDSSKAHFANCDNSKAQLFANCLDTLETCEGKFLVEKKMREICVRNNDRWEVAVRPTWRVTQLFSSVLL